jgi:ubiquinone/menaquinone biosynthesis C-methylase UbiE
LEEKLPLNNISTKQAVASSTDELRSSYNRLYQEWLGQHRNLGQAQKLLSWMDVNSGMLLDVACGLGYLLDYAEARGATAFGLDISHVALKKSKIEKPSRPLTEGNGEYLPWPDETFDFVTCLGSLEHFIRPEMGAREISRVLKPNGKAAIMLPNSHHIQAIYNVYKTGGILPELQDFERFATRVEWQAFLEKNGLKVQSVHKYNVGFSRFFKKGREGFFFVYNSIFTLFGDFWIPVNLSFALTFVCTKTPIPNAGHSQS